MKFEDSNSIVENIDFTRLIQDDQFAIQTLKKIYRNNNKFFFYNIDIDDLVINFRETSKFKYSDLNVSNDIDFRLAFLYRNLSIRYKKIGNDEKALIYLLMACKVYDSGGHQDFLK